MRAPTEKSHPLAVPMTRRTLLRAAAEAKHEPGESAPARTARERLAARAGKRVAQLSEHATESRTRRGTTKEQTGLRVERPQPVIMSPALRGEAKAAPAAYIDSRG